MLQLPAVLQWSPREPHKRLAQKSFWSSRSLIARRGRPSSTRKKAFRLNAYSPQMSFSIPDTTNSAFSMGPSYAAKFTGSEARHCRSPSTEHFIQAVRSGAQHVAYRDVAVRHHLGIDAAIGMAIGPHQRLGDREVADAGVGIHVGGGTAHDALHHLEPRAGDRNLLPEQLELAPGRPAL